MEEQRACSDRPAGSRALRIKKLHPNARLPRRATEGASGLDLFACIEEGDGRVLLREKPRLIGTGIAIEVPSGYDVQIRPRSGLSSIRHTKSLDCSVSAMSEAMLGAVWT